MSIDKESPPGAWKTEMERMPWRYSDEVQFNRALDSLRSNKFAYEAVIIMNEFNRLHAEIDRLKKELIDDRESNTK